MDRLIAIQQAARERRKLLAVLIDPDKPLTHWLRQPELLSLPQLLLVGGSTGTRIDDCIRTLRTLTTRPLLLFPGNPAQLSPDADALLYLSVLNSRNPDMLVGLHIRAALAVRDLRIETIPMGYILIDGGRPSAAARVADAQPLPASDITGAVSMAVAAQLLGKQLVYLEAGSGAAHPVPADLIRAVRSEIDIPLLVGGGICSPEQARAAWDAGADIVVIGNHFEHSPEQLPLFLP